MTKHLIIPDAHAHPEKHNKRADLLAHLMYDLRPDTVINIGDTWDLPSMSSYEKGTKAFHGRNYEKDIDAGLDFTDRMFSKYKKMKKKLPTRYFFVGNHEHRINRALNLQPELEGEKFGVSIKDLQLERYYNHVVPYSGGSPGVLGIDGINYAHYFVTGVMGNPVGGEHSAYSLLTKQFQSCTQGHTHTLDYSTRVDAHNSRINGLVCGHYQDYVNDWVGNAVGRLWWSGVVIKHNVDGYGNYDLELVSLERLKKHYGVKW